MDRSESSFCDKTPGIQALEVDDDFHASKKHKVEAEYASKSWMSIENQIKKVQQIASEI